MGRISELASNFDWDNKLEDAYIEKIKSLTDETENIKQGYAKVNDINIFAEQVKNALWDCFTLPSLVEDIQSLENDVLLKKLKDNPNIKAVLTPDYKFLGDCDKYSTKDAELDLINNILIGKTWNKVNLTPYMDNGYAENIQNMALEELENDIISFYLYDKDNFLLMYINIDNTQPVHNASSFEKYDRNIVRDVKFFADRFTEDFPNFDLSNKEIKDSIINEIKITISAYANKFQAYLGDAIEDIYYEQHKTIEDLKQKSSVLEKDLVSLKEKYGLIKNEKDEKPDYYVEPEEDGVIDLDTMEM